jgi:hypothetical protein
LELTIELVYPQEMTVKLPGSDTDYGDFTIYQVNQGSPSAVNEKLNRINHILILEPGLPGEHKLPKLPFKFWDTSGKPLSCLSETMDFTVSSVINAGQKEIADIIIVEEENEYWLIAVGFLLIISPICFLATRKRSKLLSPEEKLDIVYEKFCLLKDKSPDEILKGIPQAVVLFFKEKFSLQSLPDNIDVVLRELDSRIAEEQKSSLQSSINEFNIIRYSKESPDPERISRLWQKFDEALNCFRENAS